MCTQGHTLKHRCVDGLLLGAIATRPRDVAGTFSALSEQESCPAAFALRTRNQRCRMREGFRSFESSRVGSRETISLLYPSAVSEACRVYEQLQRPIPPAR